MKLRFSVSLAPRLVESAARSVGATLDCPRVQFDVTVAEPHTQEGMVAYFESMGATFVGADPSGAPGVT
jgi:hypothetical protein